MARVTHVKSAQQRYRMIPLLDDDGKQVIRTAVRKRPTKAGKTESNVRATVADRNQPLDPLSCDMPGCQITEGKILPGQPYKWVKPKSGPYGGRQRNRHESHRSWYSWELSDSLNANIDRIVHDFESGVDGAESAGDIESARDDAAAAIRELSETKAESAQSVEDGFGHPTFVSEQLTETAEALDAWADEVEAVDIDEPEEVECDVCGGTGEVANKETKEMDTCDAEGCEDGQIKEIEDWLETAAQAVMDVLGSSPA